MVAFAPVTLAPGTRFFLLLVALVTIERVFEMALSLRNARRARALGAVEGESRGFYLLMVVAHVVFLAAGPIEVLLFERPFIPPIAIVATWIVVLTMALRYWAIVTLGDRWNTRVLVVPGAAAVASGPYRFVRHPNYVAVVLEVAALPLVHCAWLTALLATVANALLLVARIRHEERALEATGNYRERLAGRARLLPWGEA
ncbi:MAG: isoprenylcysteine carboxylmethyltransferase family protein [Thermoanaerobaculia bacterium]